MKIVTTATSRYLLDEDRSEVTRLPGKGAGDDPDLTVAELRRDGETLELLEMLRLEQGKPMEMMVQVREDDVATWRQTTPVRHIEDAA